MSKYRDHLPQLDDRLFMTDGGLETTLIFHEGTELPYFAAFDLLKDPAGTDQLRRYYRRYAGMAAERGLGLTLEAPTWRANRDWGVKLGYDSAQLAAANRKAIELMLEIREAFETPATPIVISGVLGPRGAGYSPGSRMSATEARDYHAAQIETFAATEADMVAVYTMNYIEEAIGVAAAASESGMPVAVSFTLETDGRLPSGDTLARAIERTDEETNGAAAYYMINCAHPTHFQQVLEPGAPWTRRLRGLRANASRRSHAELDESPDLDAGDPDELGGQYRALKPLLSQLCVVGGCCGTDHRHVASICAALANSAVASAAKGIGETTPSLVIA
jgi:S-methylmethionine-dependent homocysteine/selenocysteine methylase